MNIKKELDKQLVQQQQIADVVGEQHNDLMLIKQFMTRRIEAQSLTAVQQKKFELYEFIYNQLMGGKFTESEVIEMIINKTKGTKPMAIQLLNDTKELFTTTLSINKQWEYKKQLHLNDILIKKAQLAGDWRAVASFEKNRTKMLEQIEVIEEQQEEFKGHTLIVTADPGTIGVSAPDKKELNQLLADLKEKYQFEIDDAEIIE